MADMEKFYDDLIIINLYRSVSNSAGAVAEFETLLLGMSVENLEETKEWKDDTVIGL